jgi:hypothetical protein
MDCQWMAFGFHLLDLNSCTAAGYQTQGTTARSWTHTSNCYRAVVITSTFDSAKYPSRMLTAYVLSLLQEPRSLLQWIEVSLVQSIAAQIYEYVTVNNFCISQLRKYARLCRLIVDVNWSMILSSWIVSANICHMPTYSVVLHINYFRVSTVPAPEPPKTEDASHVV